MGWQLVDRIRLLTFPHEDGAFAAHIAAARGSLGHWDASVVEAEVRKAYPNATFRRSAQLAQFDADDETWYAFRDGRSSTQDTARWWDDEDLPRTVMDESGRYIDANQAALDLLGVSRDRLLASRAGDFSQHEGTDEVRRALFGLLAERGELHSTAVVLRPDGARWPIEYRTWRIPRAEGFITAMRRVRRAA
jgi:PAS domain S-box-containing protein